MLVISRGVLLDSPRLNHTNKSLRCMIRANLNVDGSPVRRQSNYTPSQITRQADRFHMPMVIDSMRHIHSAGAARQQQQCDNSISHTVMMSHRSHCHQCRHCISAVRWRQLLQVINARLNRKIICLADRGEHRQVILDERTLKPIIMRHRGCESKPLRLRLITGVK